MSLKMNLPNKLTASRFLLTVLFLWALFSPFRYNDTLALFFFCFAGVTDFLDGRIARSRNLITNFGKLMDPLADKIMTCSAFIAFVAMPETHVKVWMVVIIVARELAITGLRLIAASKNLVLAAEGFGKHKTISQIVAIIAILTVRAYPQWGGAGKAVFGFEVLGRPWADGFAFIAIWIAVGLTILSGSIYLWKNREIYLQDM
jgi:CDP-diacylglycerol--glycerol-3-phosphate 3-phosphatidyltransferase